MRAKRSNPRASTTPAITATSSSTVRGTDPIGPDAPVPEFLTHPDRADLCDHMNDQTQISFIASRTRPNWSPMSNMFAHKAFTSSHQLGVRGAGASPAVAGQVGDQADL